MAKELWGVIFKASAHVRPFETALSDGADSEGRRGMVCTSVSASAFGMIELVPRQPTKQPVPDGVAAAIYVHLKDIEVIIKGEKHVSIGFGQG